VKEHIFICFKTDMQSICHVKSLEVQELVLQVESMYEPKLFAS